MIHNFFTDGATVGLNGKLGSVTEIGLGVYDATAGKHYQKKVDGISNNEAEFKALIWGMSLALEQNVRRAHFHLDSEIVVNRAHGKRPKKKKFQNPRMDAFQDQVLALARDFEVIDFIWIPREQNAVADELSKRAAGYTF